MRVRGTVLLAATLVVPMAMAQAQTVKLEPSSASGIVGDTFDFNIVGEDFGMVLDGGGLNLSFDAGVLEFNSFDVDETVWDPDISSGGGFPFELTQPSPGVVEGIVFNSFNGPSGSFNIGTISFTGIGNGESDIELSAYGLNPFASGGQVVDVEFEDASVEVGPIDNGEDPAVPLVNTSSVDFGVVRVGDTVDPQAVSISNDAEDGSENLNAAAGDSDDGVTGSGSFSGLEPGDTNDTDIVAGIDTSSAGNKSGNLSIDFESENGDVTDLPSQDVAVTGTVNALANPVLTQDGGDGDLSGSGVEYLLDFGSVEVGEDGTLTAMLSLLNDVDTPADFLSGEFDVSGVGEFEVSGFGSVENVGPGESASGLMVMWTLAGLGVDTYTGSIVLDPMSVYPDLADVDLANITLNLVGEVVGTEVIPLPGAVYLLGTALASLFGIGYGRRRRAQA